ncbi:MBL fold metallo-hydrolase [Paenibacillus ginsengarvi]|uniref:MBL fold metallo-hydrolase n=1 Tax=Paenibacillus ginsengarvi TaxID=400777 RepID=A0A3B0BUR1_9BACL|nr:MBL fold metallo-hydrolase [Paenibacillus ginsengarvi]RKN77145.1 MBL fold metallo-hydrolase [Paenibacillus ginsengarvi]
MNGHHGRQSVTPEGRLENEKEQLPLRQLPKVGLRLFAAGYCKHPEWVTIRGGSRRSCRIPALFACIQHPELGAVLVDTGYSGAFLRETGRLPGRLYRAVTPVTFREEESAVRQLAACGIAAEQVRTIVITHFHADHIAGLNDFPHARFVYLPAAYDAVKRLHGLAALRRAFLPGLLPAEFEARSRPIRTDRRILLPAGFPFADALDVLGDGSVLAVELPGHADGQIGLLLATDKHDYLLCADAAWSGKAVRENRPPHPLAGLVMANRREYADSFRKLASLVQRYPRLRIVASHCPDVWHNWIQGGEAL